jgi:hypothetical protein
MDLPIFITRYLLKKTAQLYVLWLWLEKGRWQNNTEKRHRKKNYTILSRKSILKVILWLSKPKLVKNKVKYIIWYKEVWMMNGMGAFLF